MLQAVLLHPPITDPTSRCHLYLRAQRGLHRYAVCDRNIEALNFCARPMSEAFAATDDEMCDAPAR
jgi:hypothetical protein